jgi:UDP-N-acetylmuramoyl-L-alanyl-D-glutamate--2,6-diaminopimelate ligase
MPLREILRGVALRGAPADPAWGDRLVSGIEYDSRRVSSGDLFFAFAGARVDGRSFAKQALSRGACAVVSELPSIDELARDWFQVEHGRKALALASGKFLHHPDQRVLFTGVTGTNGKTTTAYLIDAILRHAGRITGMIGTIEYRVANETRVAVNTTPESLDVLRLASELETRGGTHLTMEVSSHALALARVHGYRFHTAVFTNLTRDHLDFHQTMEAYSAAKRLLFQPEAGDGPAWAVLNADDPASSSMTPVSSHANVLWYGLAAHADLRAESVRSDFNGLHFDLSYRGQRQPLHSPLVGAFNVSNILAASGAALSYGLALPQIADGITACRSVPGRFERVDVGQPFLVVVDYAHTDDALRNTIQAARNLLRQQKHGRLITLFGCGGDRDRTKRPLMGAAAAEGSDFVVLTSDNPRSEDPLDIMNDVMVGLRRFDTPLVAEPGRAKAIERAIAEAKSGDIVLLAGKGHEPYQILKDRTIDFDDRATARGILGVLGYGPHVERGSK